MAEDWEEDFFTKAVEDKVKSEENTDTREG